MNYSETTQLVQRIRPDQDDALESVLDPANTLLEELGIDLGNPRLALAQITRQAAVTGDIAALARACRDGINSVGKERAKGLRAYRMDEMTDRFAQLALLLRVGGGLYPERSTLVDPRRFRETIYASSREIAIHGMTVTQMDAMRSGREAWKPRSAYTGNHI